MKINQLILIKEAPLPPDWDANVFSNRNSFAAMIRYAKERAAQVGRGSSRVAFIVPYQGRKTVLKIALNNKGLAQNTEEARLLSDYMVPDDIVIPMIDYDEKNTKPTWIHTEFAHKITQKQLERFFGGVPMRTITMHLDSMSGRSRTNVPIPEELFDNELYTDLEALVGNFNLPAGDFARKANWGLYKNKPVIIDLGFTGETEKLYR